MVRSPCCENMGLKKGQWTPEEDRILISYIQQFGHSNWRALPKQAGLQRCGKSCRLRWTNYLRPDIKRGYFSKEEEETIIKLHQIVGNRWSTIAARLPGRTDNEIKNYWHINLKKKAKQVQEASSSSVEFISSNHSSFNTTEFLSPSKITQNSLGKMSSSLGVSIMGSSTFNYSSSRPISVTHYLKSNNSDDILSFWYDIYQKTGELMLQEGK